MASFLQPYWRFAKCQIDLRPRILPKLTVDIHSYTRRYDLPATMVMPIMVTTRKAAFTFTWMSDIDPNSGVRFG